MKYIFLTLTIFFVQDVCKSCGSFGLGEEGKLIVCTQCGQCYHPFCASVKVRTQLLKITLRLIILHVFNMSKWGGGGGGRGSLTSI